jgi:hypothetical protein
VVWIRDLTAPCLVAPDTFVLLLPQPTLNPDGYATGLCA